MLLISIAFYFVVKIVECEIDPCTTDVLKLNRERYRGTLCSGLGIFQKTNDALLKAGWYRVDGESMSLNMPNSPPNLHSCGSYNPIWMNGIDKNCPPIDPCDEFYRKEDIRDDGFRSTTCQVSPPRCDNNLQEGWYRMLDSSWRNPLKIPTDPQSSHSCGTDNPLWINGSTPAENEGIATRKVCRTSTCDRSFQIQIKNCSSFIVYELKPAPQCPERYCLDDDTKCQTQIVSTVPTSTDVSLKQTQSSDADALGIRDITLIVVAVFIFMAAVIGGITVYVYKMKIGRINPDEKQDNKPNGKYGSDVETNFHGR